MYRNETASQMLALKKFAFDSTCSVMVLFQEQAEKIMNLYLDQATFLPQEGKKLAAEWLKAAKTSRDYFKKMMDGGFKTIESYFA